jgi:predicted  nucleic acid-binding Zn-ribbon protein
MDTQKVKELYKKHTTNENNLEELEKWITEYDEPIERSSVADIFYDLKDEITYLKMEINMCEKAIEEDEKTKQRLCDQIDFYITALREIDTHIRATSEPVSYIIKTLLKTLPEYTIEDENETPRNLNDWMK